MKDNKILFLAVILLLISMCAAAFVNYKRMVVEKEDNSVNIVLDNNDIERLSVLNGARTSDLYKKFADIGVVSVALTEDLATIPDVNYLLGVDPKKINLYIPSRGLSESKKRQIESSGLAMIPRIRNLLDLNSKIIDSKLKEVSKYKIVIFAEEEVLGYPNYLIFTAKALKGNGLKYGFVEFGKQLGDTALASYMGGNLVKVHSIPLDEMEKMDRKEMLERYLRAVRERGVRLLYVHLLQYPDKGEGLISSNISYLSTIISELKKEGFVIGSASVPGNVALSKYEISMIGAGVAAGLILLIFTFTSIGLSVAFVTIILFAIMPVKFLTLCAAIIFPSYAVISQFMIRPKGPSMGVLSYAVSAIMNIAGVSALGAVMISALLADKVPLIGVDAFTGVKIAFIMPILIVVTYFLVRDENGHIDIKRFVNRTFEILDTHVKLLHIALFVVASGAAAILILRSGNFGLPIPGGEKVLRAALENILSVRPRTKEFLIGYPALFIASAYFLKGGNKWLWMILAVGVLAPISLVNSFCHIHTPVMISVARSCIGIILGAFIGLLIYMFLGVLLMVYNKYITK